MSRDTAAQAEWQKSGNDPHRRNDRTGKTS